MTVPAAPPGRAPHPTAFQARLHLRSDLSFTLHATGHHWLAARAWLPHLRAQDLLHAQLGQEVDLRPGGATPGPQVPGAARRIPYARLRPDPEVPGALELCGQERPFLPARPAACLPLPPGAPDPTLLPWLNCSLDEMWSAAAPHLRAAGVRHALISDGRRLYHLGSPSASGVRVPLGDPRQPLGMLWLRDPPVPSHTALAGLVAVLTLAAQQAQKLTHLREQLRASDLRGRLSHELLDQASPGGAVLAGALLPTVACLLNAHHGQLITLTDPASPERLRRLLRRLPDPLAGQLLDVSAPGETERTLLLAFPAPGARRFAWVLRSAHHPAPDSPDNLTAVLTASRQVALRPPSAALHSTPRPGQHLLGLLQTLGHVSIPFTLTERGLQHLTGQDAPLNAGALGAYLSIDPHGSRPPAGHLTPLIQVSGPWPDDLLSFTQLGAEPSSAQPLTRTVRHGRQTQQLTLAPVRHDRHLSGLLALLGPPLDDDTAAQQQALLTLLAQHVSAAGERSLTVHTLNSLRERTFQMLGTVLEHRSNETKGHTDRVTRLALHLALHLDLNLEDLTHLRWGAYLHDIGKIAIPDSVLHKNGPLTPPERDLIRRHVLIGEQILTQAGLVPPEVLQVVRHHHERWDGHGYPDQLRGPDIPLLARIFAVADVYDALTSARTYKDSWTPHDAQQELRRMAGQHLDPGLVDTCLHLLKAPPA